MIIRRSTYNRLIARADAYAQSARDARRVQQAAVNSASRIAERSTAQQIAIGRRFTRILLACARYRQELAAETRRADRLQERLDHAVGLDAPALDQGAHWQQRRTDKPKPVHL